MNVCKRLWPCALAAAGLLGTGPLAAQEDKPLGAMAGVGGVVRETESRAVAPAPTDPKPTPALAAPNVDAVPDTPDPGPFWDIESILYSGDEAFAQQAVFDAAPRSIAGRLDAFLDTDPAQKSRRMVEAELTRILKELIEQGYYLARVSLAGYDANAKALGVRVDTAVFGNITTTFPDGRENGLWFSRAQIERRFASYNAGEPFNYRRLHATLSEVNAHPDLTLDTNIKVRPGDDGLRFADLNFAVREKFPLHAMLEVNNYADASIGKWTASLTVQYLNLLRQDDVLTYNPAISLDGLGHRGLRFNGKDFKEPWPFFDHGHKNALQSHAGSYMIPNRLWNGGSTTFYGGWSSLNAHGIVRYLDLYGKSKFVGATQSVKLIDDKDRLLSASAGLLYRYIADRFDVTITDETLQSRSLSVLPATLSLSYSDKTHDLLNGRNFATLSYIANLRTGGQNDIDDFWVDANSRYQIARAQLARLQPLNFHGTPGNPVHQWTVFAKAEGQCALTDDPLIPSEKLFLGGYSTVRGYKTKGYMGDDGVYGSVEFRTPILLDLVGQSFNSGTTPVDRMQFLAFVDGGHAHSLKPMPGVESNRDLLSAGVGARLAITQYSQFRFDVGFPLINKADEEMSTQWYNFDGKARWYFGGQLQF